MRNLKYTGNYNLKKPDGTDVVNIQDLNDNADILDQKLKEVEGKANSAPANSVNDAAIGTRTPDASQVPASPGTGTMTQLVSWMTNRIKAITGKTNWWDAPVKNIQQLADDHAAHLADNTQHVTYAVTTGLANTYVVTLSPAPTAYVAGMALAVKINIDSTGASTINVNNLGAKGIKKANGSDVTNLKAGGIYTLRYDGVNFILQGEGASGNATASDLLLGKTATTDAGEITGTIPTKSAATITPGTTNQVIAAGQYLAGNQTILGDADLKASNLPVGVNIFGVAGSRSAIKSIQRGTASFVDGATSATVSVTGVDLTKAVLLVTYNNSSSDNAAMFINGVITNSTTLTFTRDTGSRANYFSWQLIEFNNVKSLQSGIFTLGVATSGTVTISTVTTSKAIVFISFTGTSSNIYYDVVSAELTNATTITFKKGGAGGSNEIAWQVIEFN